MDDKIKKEEGYYWVKFHPTDEYRPAYFYLTGEVDIHRMGGIWKQDDLFEIGERIQPPK